MNPIMKSFVVFLFSLFLSAFFCVQAAKVDTVVTYSHKMQKDIKAVVITPNSYSRHAEFPVLYLLHGYSDRYDGWITKVPAIKDLADLYDMIIVCPDGAYGSWYLDSPINPDFQYETYIAIELVNWIDKNYPTIPSRTGRAITGLSMGGHGALYLAFRHQDIFGAAGSMSGGVDIRPFPNNWDLEKRLGKQSEYPERWEQHTVIELLHLLTPNSLKLIIDCGTEDFFYEVNKKLHEELLYRNIPHDFISRPGVHNWEYWENAIKYQALFFNRYFETNKTIK
jgi:S-formylglutathione hydrolase FrmB